MSANIYQKKKEKLGHTYSITLNSRKEVAAVSNEIRYKAWSLLSDVKTQVQLIIQGSLHSHQFEYIELKQEDKSGVSKMHTQHFQSKKKSCSY